MGYTFSLPNQAYFPVIAFSNRVEREATTGKVGGGILVPVELFWEAAMRSERRSREGFSRADFKLTCIPTLLGAPPPKQ